jgi:hypothetical protein
VIPGTGQDFFGFQLSRLVTVISNVQAFIKGHVGGSPPMLSHNYTPFAMSNYDDGKQSRHHLQGMRH